MPFLRYESCPRCRDRGADRRGDNLALYTDGGAHCFSCGYHRGARFSGPRNVNRSLDGPKGLLPADFSREVPARGWQWLLQYGLGYKYWEPFVGWSETHQRLVLTVGEPTEFAIGRYLGDETGHRKWYAYGDMHKTPHVFGHGLGETTVVVEDLVSAHKVGQVCTCLPLFGTRIFSSVLPCLRWIGNPVLMWLDKDQDIHARKRAQWLNVMTGLPVRYLSTNDDPKSLSLETIRATISGQPS